MGRLANTGLIRWFSLVKFAVLFALPLLFWLSEDHVLGLLNMLMRYWYAGLKVLGKLCKVADGSRAVMRRVCLTYDFHVHVFGGRVDVWRFIAAGQTWIGVLDYFIGCFATLGWSSAIWSFSANALSSTSRLSSSAATSHRDIKSVLLGIRDSLRLETCLTFSVIAFDAAASYRVTIWVFITALCSMKRLCPTQAVAGTDCTRARIYPLSRNLTAIWLVIITDMERWWCIDSDGTFVCFLTQHSSFDLSLFLPIFFYNFH